MWSLFILLYIKVLVNGHKPHRLVYDATIAIDAVYSKIVKKKTKIHVAHNLFCHNFKQIIIWMAMKIKISLFLMPATLELVCHFANSLQQSRPT